MEKNKLGNYSIVVIGGSAGSLDVILKIVAALPLYSGATFVLVVHRKNDGESLLLNLLSSRTLMTVKEVEDKEPILPNTIYIAPTDYHLLIEDRHSFSLDASEKIHFSRPSIDVTFESVAGIFGPSVIGLLLSGANADGAAGLQAIKRAGGYAIVQDPLTANVGYMPQQAINAGGVNAILNVEAIDSVLLDLLG